VVGPAPSPFVAELTTEPDPEARRSVVAHRTPPTASTSRRSTAAAEPGAALDAAGKQRYLALRELRNELRDGKPAYVVFDNRTLEAIARTAPASPAELARIPGIGPAKLEKYGAAVIDTLRRLAEA
jgi:superfamily II DNA helicase RecQ